MAPERNGGADGGRTLGHAVLEQMCLDGMGHRDKPPATVAMDNGGMSLPIDCAGEPLTLLPDRAIWWPCASTLLAADVHLGKAAALRRQGVAVPRGSSEADLARLSALITHWGAQRLLLLGDVFHAAPNADEPMMAAFDAFRARHPNLHIQITTGNHDRPPRLPPTWQLDWQAAALCEPPFVFRHTPESDPRGYVLSGHVHPTWVLRTARERARLPVFWLGAAVGVLPAFGQLTGGFEISPVAGDRLYGVLPNAVVALPTPAPERPRASRRLPSHVDGAGS